MLIVTKMDKATENTYDLIRSGRPGFHEQPRGLIAVWGKEAVPFLDGMITNDTKTLADGASMLAAFPNAQGRLIAVVRVQRQGDRFLIETEAGTRERVFQNLFRFTFAGDFFADDLSSLHSHFEILGPKEIGYDPNVAEKWPGALVFDLPNGAGYFIPNGLAEKFRKFLSDEKKWVAIDNELNETLRIEGGIPKYGIDMDETTIVPELGLDGLISYNKGCYIGQEIIARIHFRGHVAKQLTGLILSDGPTSIRSNFAEMPDLQTLEGKNAGRITSAAFSPRLGQTIALAFVRYEHLAPGTELVAGDTKAIVSDLPFAE